MPLMAKQGATIAEFRELREELNITYQQIADKTEENGESISISTIKRVFAKEAETQKFKPDTINAIGKVLFDEKLQRDQCAVDDPSHEVDVINSLLDYNNIAIGTLERENERLQEESTRKHEHILELTEQNKILIARSNSLTNQVKKKDRIIFWTVFSLILCLVIIIIALIVDRMNLDMGYFWRGMSALVNGESDVLAGHSVIPTADILLTYIFGN